MKFIFTLILLTLGLLAQAQIPSYVPTNGLVGWWPFNGNANDESGNGNHGTVNGATLAADRFGNAGKAYSFDGVDDFVEVVNNPNFAFLLNSSFSVSIWFNSTNLISTYSLIGQGDSDGQSQNRFWKIYLNGLFIQSHIRGNLSDPFDTKNNYQLNLTNSWFMITMTRNFNNNLNLFVNGQLVDIDNDITGISNQFNVQRNILLGAFLNSYNSSYIQYFPGRLDDIAIYNRALSASEVQQLYLGCLRQPTFTAQPQNKSVAQGQTTTFAVQVDSASRYQWQMNLGLGAGWTNIPASALFSGDTTATLTVEGRNPLDGARFRCIATSCNADTSNAATLTVTSSATAAAGTVAGVPGLINYQGSALDSAGKPMKNQTIALKLSVLDSSSTGAAVYVESHSASTNVSGHFAIQIGGGTAILGSFDSVGWANGRNKYLKTELSQNGTWVSLGTSQLVSVPYALHAGSAENATNASYATFFKDSLGNAYQVKTVNGQPTLVAAPGSGSSSNPGSFACGQSVTYAGESYPTVQIGNQCWFQKNLNVGTMVPGVNDQLNNITFEKYCYNDLPANCDTFGGLYQWAEAVQYQNGASNTTSPSPAFSGNVKGICPTGWHVPSDGEWCTLTTFLDSTVNCSVFGWTGTNAGGKLKSISSLWNSPNTGATNSSGFSALPGGYGDSNGGFFNKGGYTFVWSSFQSSNTIAVSRALGYDFSDISRGNGYPKDDAFSIRCLKD
jgi:uncharacterized protein (TIGR02145 family)